MGGREVSGAVSVNISIIVMRGGHCTGHCDHWTHIPRLC